MGPGLGVTEPVRQALTKRRDTTLAGATAIDLAGAVAKDGLRADGAERGVLGAVLEVLDLRSTAPVPAGFLGLDVLEVLEGLEVTAVDVVQGLRRIIRTQEDGGTAKVPRRVRAG